MNILMTLVLSLGLISCASSYKKEVAHDREMLSPQISKDEMVNKLRASLEDMKGISDEQKERLVDIHAEVMVESWEINQKIREHKIVLFKYLGELDYKPRKVSYVKKKIKDLYLKKLDIMLGAFDKVKKALGKDADKVIRSEDFRLYHGISFERF